MISICIKKLIALFYSLFEMNQFLIESFFLYNKNSFSIVFQSYFFITDYLLHKKK